jgi:hypothetical protein
MIEQTASNPFQRVAQPRGLERWIPAIAAVRTYQRAWLPKDIVAGLVLTAILVPVGMGYAEAAGLSAICGLYATNVPLIAYAIFGPGRILVLGPDSSLAAIIAATIVPLAAGNTDLLVSLAGMLALMTGSLCILAGLARFGFVTDLLSKPIRLGYLNGIALTVIIGQLPKLLGFSSSGELISSSHALTSGRRLPGDSPGGMVGLGRTGTPLTAHFGCPTMRSSVNQRKRCNEGATHFRSVLHLRAIRIQSRS